MATKFRSNVAAARAAATRGGNNKFTPTFKWEAGETKYLQFDVDFNDEDDSGVTTVLMHRFIITGEREDGGEIYNDFISRRDKNLDGNEGYDPIIDRFGYQPSERSIMVAVELEPVWTDGPRKTISGFDIATRQFKRDEETVEVPNVALVIESPYTFYSQMFNLADMGEDFSTGVYAVRRSGKGTDTTYTFKCVGEAIDLDEELAIFENEFDLDAWLENLADEDRIHELIDPLPDDAIISKYPPKGAKGAKGKGKSEKAEKKAPAPRSTRTRRPKAEAEAPVEENEPDEPEVEDEAPAPEPEAEESTPRRRTRKFSDLKVDSKRG